MVGIVIVSHSARLADGVVELAREMAGPEVVMVAAGGLDLPGRPLGTDAAFIARAIEAAWADDGVLVLMDLGSAVLSAEMAAEMMPDERQSRLLLCEAPLVEGAVAAAVAARLGDPLDKVAAEARGGRGRRMMSSGRRIRFQRCRRATCSEAAHRAYIGATQVGQVTVNWNGMW